MSGGMKDIEPTLLGSPDLPDISVSSGCRDEQIYDVSVKNKGGNRQLHLPCLMSILCTAYMLLRKEIKV